MVINGASLPESLLEALGMPSGGGFQIKLVRSGGPSPVVQPGQAGLQPGPSCLEPSASARLRPSCGLAAGPGARGISIDDIEEGEGEDSDRSGATIVSRWLARRAPTARPPGRACLQLRLILASAAR